MTTVVLLLFALFCVVLARPDRQFNLLGRSFRQLQRQNAALNPQYETRWFNTRLDHFNAHVLPYEFPMRYLINSTFFDVKNGPVFFYTGNEGDIELFAANTGLVWEWAAEFNALIVFAEHRYYGQSLPFGNASFTGSNPGYLSVAQVLSDYTALVSALQIEFHPDGQSRSPVIAFGGSYGGMLSAWWRVRYPHAVDGALAASAPILQFENVTDSMVFNHLASQDYVEQLMHESRTALGTCDMAWSAALNAIQDMANNSSAWSDLSSTFTLCSPLQSAANVSTLVNWLTSGLVDQAMTDYPAPTSFLQPIPAWPVNVSCRVFDQCLSSVKSQNKLDSIVRCAAQAIQIYYNGTGVTKCNDILSDATADLGEQGWDYQSCTEMV
jgi:lysosomal Pro-X carboxypeptidase